MPSQALVEGMLENFPAVFARLTGRNGVVREYKALVAPAAWFCVIPTVDAYQLGYSEVVPSDSRIPLPNTKTFASYTGYGRGTEIKMAQVDIGGLSFKDVEFLAYDLMQAIGLDVVLGRNLFRDLRLEENFSSGRLRVEKTEVTP